MGKLTVLSGQIDPDQLNAPKTMKERVQQTCRFLDSLKSLMEQEVMEHDLIKLRFKYFNFDQLSEKNDFIRIHQLYEQLKYTILSDEFTVTEDQALTLASLQYYIDDCHKKKIVDDSFHIQENNHEKDAHNSSFDIDNMLDNLEIELEGKDRTKDQADLPTIPELSDLVRIYHPHRLLSSLGKFQDKKWLIYKDTMLSAFKSREDAATNATGNSVSRVEIKRAELTTETSVKNGVFIVKLKQVIKIQDIDDKSIDNPDQLAAVRTKFYVSKKHLKKLGHAKIAAHVLSHQAKIGDSVRQQPTLAKMTYIHVWEHIEHAGRAYFQVNFKKDSKKEDFVALSSEKIMRMDSSGKIVQSWWLQTLREWKINWAAEPKRVELFLNKDTEEHEKIEFFISHRSNPIKDLQVIHEYIGGYMFHHMTKQVEPDDAEEVKLRGLLDVTDPWHQK